MATKKRNVNYLKMQFKDYKCLVIPAFYNNGRKALKLVEDGPLCEEIATATVNVVAHHCEDDYAYIKDYSENEGMVEALVKAKIIKPQAFCFVTSGHVTIGMYELTEKTLNLFE